jgi:serine/threonine protein kinase
MSHATVPSKIGKYDIIRKIDQSNDIVYEAYDATTSRRVAVKELAIPAGATASQTQGRVERFQREARAVGRLTHANIVTIYEVGTDGYRHFIAMEFVEGETLGEVISRSHSITTDNIRSYVRQLLNALQCAHASGVVHRDVKPENVFLSKTGVIKLADFGIARIEVEPTITLDGQIFGTPSYMAPEQIKGGEILPGTDLWAVGVIGYELATGEKPFVGQGLLDTFQQIQTKTPDLNKIKDSNLKLLVEQLLEKDPARRLKTAHDAISILDSEDLQPATPSVQSTITFTQPSLKSGSAGKRLALVSSILVISAAAFFAGRFNAASTREDATDIGIQSPTQPFAEISPKSDEEVIPYTPEIQASQPDESIESDRQNDQSGTKGPAPEPPENTSNPRPLISKSQSSSPRKDEDAPSTRSFTIGSSEEELIAVMGTPKSINDYSSFKVFRYGSSMVTIEGGRVKDYDNDGNLKVRILSTATSKGMFTIGSSEAELIAVMGTPKSINDYSSFKVFRYGSSMVTIEGGRVRDYDNDGNLKVK